MCFTLLLYLIVLLFFLWLYPYTFKLSHISVAIVSLHIHGILFFLPDLYAIYVCSTHEWIIFSRSYICFDRLVS